MRHADVPRGARSDTHRTKALKVNAPGPPPGTGLHTNRCVETLYRRQPFSRKGRTSSVRLQPCRHKKPLPLSVAYRRVRGTDQDFGMSPKSDPARHTASKYDFVKV